MAEFGFTAGGVNDGLAATAGHAGARQNQIGPFPSRDQNNIACRRRVDGIGMARHWLGFACEHREIQAQLVGLDQASIGGHLVSLLQQDSVARHEQLGI